MQIVTVTKCINNHHILNAFLEHYIWLGMDKIIIYFYLSQNNNFRLLEKYKSFVEIIYCESIEDTNENYKKNTKNDNNWYFYVEISEYLFLSKRFTNLKEMIYHYQMKRREVNIIKFGKILTHNFILNEITLKDIVLCKKKYLDRDEDGIYHRTLCKKSDKPCVALNNIIIEEDKEKYKINRMSYYDGFVLNIFTINLCDVLQKSGISEDLKHLLKKFEWKKIDTIILKEFIEEVGHFITYPIKSKELGEINNATIIDNVRIPNVNKVFLFDNLNKEKGISLKVLTKLAELIEMYFD